MANIIIDLTPILPGGANGGAKPMVIELVKQLSLLAPHDKFILLTSYHSHDELADLDSANVSRLCALLPEKKRSFCFNFIRRCFSYAKRKLFALKNLDEHGTYLLEKLNADLLFCPFTAPFFYSPNIPIVSVIYDLQYLEYPYLFSADVRIERDGHFRKACQYASYLICISEFTRQSVLQFDTNSFDPKKVISIPIHISDEYLHKKIDKKSLGNLLEQHQLKAENFLFYPANFWMHKNHKMLFLAFSLYCKKHSNSSLKLVCTGSPGEKRDLLIIAAEKLGLKNRIIFPGYMSSAQMMNLFSVCKALIFPSLYEGFGIPLVEAMLLKKPILCSNKASLPEVASECGIYFDPRKPLEIVSTIEQVDCLQQASEISEKVKLGHEIAKQYTNTGQMASHYYSILKQAMTEKVVYSKAMLHGVFEDGWASNLVTITYPASKDEGVLKVVVSHPEWHPEKIISLEVKNNNVPDNRQWYKMQSGDTLTITCAMSSEGGKIHFLTTKGMFIPSKNGIGTDSRRLGCEWKYCEITFDNQSTITLFNRESVAC